MRKICLISLTLIGSLMLGVAAFGISDYASTADPSFAAFGARPLSLGGAFVGLADDSNALFLNPAGLAQIKNFEITSMSTKILERADYKLLGGSMKLGIGTLGLGYIGVSSPAGIPRNEYGTPESSSPITHDSNLIVLSYGLNMRDVMDSSEDMGDVLVGTSIKYLSKSFNGIEGAKGEGINADLGVLFKPFESFYTFGFTMQNILQDGSFSWGSGTKENMEGKTKVGGTLKLFGKSSLYYNVGTDLTLSLDADISSSLSRPMLFHMGAEWKPLEFISLRAGVDQMAKSKNETSNNLTAGVGINLSGFKFDYAYHTDENLEENKTHYFSISYSPDVKEVKKAIVGEIKEVKKTKVEKQENYYYTIYEPISSIF